MLLLAQNYLTRGFWGDEAWTSLISQLPYLQMLRTTAADFHPPAYYTVVELWYKIFPTTEISTRIISLIFFLLTGFVVYKLAGEIRGRTFGILSALVVLFNPIFFRYAFEARNYTMFAFFATCSIYFLIKLSEKFALKGGVFFVLFTTLGIYTHYYMFFVIFAQGLYLLLFSARGGPAFGWDRKIFVKMVALYFAVGILYLGWIPFLIGQLRSVSGGYWIGTIDWRNTHREALMRILGGETPGIMQLWLYRISVALMLVGLIQHLRQKSFEKPYILIWLWAVVPFVLATLPGLSVDGFKFPLKPILFWRYLIPAAVPLAMIIVHAADKLGQLKFPIIGVVIILSLAIDYQTLTSYPQNFKQVYDNEVVGKIQPSDKIVTVLPSFAEVLYYRNRNNLKNEVIVLPEGLVQFSGKSLLDAYAANRVIKISDVPGGKYFFMTPGPSLVKVESESGK